MNPYRDSAAPAQEKLVFRCRIGFHKWDYVEKLPSPLPVHAYSRAQYADWLFYDRRVCLLCGMKLYDTGIAESRWENCREDEL